MGMYKMCYFSTSLLPSTGQGRKGQQTCDRVPVPVCTRHVNVPVVVYQKKNSFSFANAADVANEQTALKNHFRLCVAATPESARGQSAAA